MALLLRDSDIYYYLLNDPLLDWLNMFGKDLFVPDTIRSDYDVRLDFTQYVKEKAVIFQEKCAQGIHYKLSAQDLSSHPSPIWQIGMEKTDIWKQSCHEATLDAMQKQVPVIKNAILHNPELRVACNIDFLVRSDLIHHFSSHSLTEEQASKKTYVVLNTAFVGLHFTVAKPGIPSHLKSTPSLNYHKAKLWLHIETLNRYQTGPQLGCLLGRKWESIHEYSNHAFDRVGVIHMEDALKRDPVAALEWRRRLQREGKDWQVLPVPSVPELYPNMKNRQSGHWAHAKKIIATELNEITRMWNVRYNHRTELHDMGYTRLEQIDDLIGLLQIKDWKYAPTMQAIHEINQESCKDLILPAKIESTKFDWQDDAPIEFFVDFETVSSLGDTLENFPLQLDTTLIAMIGLGYVEPGTKKWIHEDFSTERLTQHQEHKIIQKWLNYMTKVEKKWMVEPPAQHRVWCYSKAEANFLEEQVNSAFRRHDMIEWRHQIVWCDLQELMMDIPIVIKGCYNFSLKSVARALYKQGKIDVIWPESQIDCGLAAMIGLFRSNEEAIKQNTTMKRIPWMDDIEAYNRLDVLAMQKILDYLRTHHS